ncbi:MAG: zinc-binding dehydrogenase [Parachlamydiales bacterium]|jgi:S-(hydroxymethyl)glutathione dehydrogenase/alcohol dehydrogenase
MRTKAAILVETNKHLVIDEIEIPQLMPGQVLVEIKYSGVCHTQLLETTGLRGKDEFLPHCLGHEGSGTVIDVSKNVKKVKIGDNVILSWMKGLGENVNGTKYDWKEKKVNAGAITTFSHYAIISENRLTILPQNFPLKEAALIGCAMPTGLGAIFNTANPMPGESLAVFGCGGIGLCAIQGARIVGCAPIIAIDLNPNKLILAKEMGATHLIDASKQDPVKAIQEITSLDYAVEATGSCLVMNQALLSVRNQGGCVVIIGNAPYGNNLNIDPKQFNLGKKILGTWGGDNDPDLHFSKYCKLIQYGYFNIKPFVNNVYSLDSINLALSDLQNGKALRPIIDMSLG